MECICVIQVEQSGRISLEATIVSLQTQLSRLTQQAEFGTLLKVIVSIIVSHIYQVSCFVALQMSKKGTVQYARYPTFYSRSHFDNCSFSFFICGVFSLSVFAGPLPIPRPAMKRSKIATNHVERTRMLPVNIFSY